MSTAHRISGTPGEHGEFVVKSESHDGLAYVIQVLPTRQVQCPCIGWVTKKKCRHTEAVIRAMHVEPRPSLAQQLEKSIQMVGGRRQAPF